MTVGVIMKKNPYLKALNYAYRLLSISERSEKEIERRLKEKGHNRDRIGEVVWYLKEKDLLNDERFIRAWIKKCTQSTPKGALAIKDELLKRGLKADLVDRVFKDVDTEYDECALAKSLVDKRLKSLKSLNGVKRKKSIYGYLARRGFSFDIINDIIESI